MNIYDLFTPEELDAAIKDGLVKVRYSEDGDAIYNYSDAAMYTPGAWDNPAVQACRGLIVHPETGEILARGWSKFFNSNQPEADVINLDEPVEVTDKLDGSLGIVNFDTEGNIRVATRGSFESDQAKWATQWIREHYPFHGPGIYMSSISPLVEIIYPENRIVCKYDFEGLVLLGGVDIVSGEYHGPTATAASIGWAGEVTEVFEYRTYREALAAPPRPGKEGLVVRAGNRIVKLKQADYIHLHRIVTGLSKKSVWQHMADGGTLEDLLAPLPDELHDWTKDVWYDLSTSVDWEISKVDDIMRSLGEELPSNYTRSQFAEAAKSQGQYAPLLFLALDNRDLFPSIMKKLKPKGDSRAKVVSEDVA